MLCVMHGGKAREITNHTLKILFYSENGRSYDWIVLNKGNFNYHKLV